jgi:hypothetical protein
MVNGNGEEWGGGTRVINRKIDSSKNLLEVNKQSIFVSLEYYQVTEPTIYF